METHKPVAPYVSENSKKRVFPGGGSIDAEVVEISRPINWSSKSKSLKQKEVMFQEIIDVDVEEDFSDVKRSSGKVIVSGKGKDIVVGNGSSGNSGPVDGVRSSKKNCLSASNNPILIDELGSDFLFADEHMNMFYDELLFDDYSILQSHFDNMDIPTGVEAPIPWMPGPIKEQSVSTTKSTSERNVSGAVRNQFTSISSSTLVGQPTQFGSSWSSPGSALSKEGQLVIGSSNVKSSKILSSGAEKQSSSHCKTKFHSSGATASFGNNPSNLYKESLAHHGKKLGSSSATTSYGWGSPVSDLSYVFPKRTFPISAGIAQAQASAAMMSYFPQSLHGSATTAGCPSIPSGPAGNGEQHKNLGETLTKFRLFKKFDTVEDHSDHFYSRKVSSGNAPSKNWAKKIQEEWKILENDLPGIQAQIHMMCYDIFVSSEQ